jgi:uncharacterized protein (DUF362 family)/NAD-dependent dihydropyrimidine dehydrogenase PreA subunit
MQAVNAPYRRDISRVVLIRCASYELDVVRTALRHALSHLGGMANFIHAGEKILLKPNLLSAHRPDENVTTHPHVVQALAELCLEQQAEVIIGDSSSRDPAQLVYERTGMTSLAKKLSVELVEFKEEVAVSFPQGRQNKQFILARPVVEADGIINLPKLKTHHLTRFTAAIKNLFGCIPGLHKPEFHVRLPGVQEFSRMLVDLTKCLQPRLCVLDAVEAMHGNGPSSGESIPMRLIAISDDPVALDSVVCQLVGLKPDTVWTNYYGQEFGLGWMDSAHIQVLGDDLMEFYRPDFQVERGPEMPYNLAWRYRFLKKYISKRPVIDSELCKRCGDCIDQCPISPKALRWGKDGKKMPPVYDYDLCIRCFCCQEICPHRAIAVKSPVVRHFFNWAYDKIWMRL